MPTIAELPWQKPDIMSQYPHMLTMDAVVWSAFLRELSPALDRVAYDVHVGTPMPVPAGSSPMQLRIAAGISRKRIDVVADTGKALWVIEVKPYGNHQACGQALQYHHLFVAEYSPPPPCLAVIVCAEHDPDINDLARQHDIRIIDVAVTDF